MEPRESARRRTDEQNDNDNYGHHRHPHRMAAFARRRSVRTASPPPSHFAAAIAFTGRRRATRRRLLRRRRGGCRRSGAETTLGGGRRRNRRRGRRRRLLFHGSLDLFRADHRLAAHIGNEHLGHRDGTVGILVVLDDGGHGAAHGARPDPFRVYTKRLPLKLAGSRYLMLARRAWKSVQQLQEEISL